MGWGVLSVSESRRAEGSSSISVSESNGGCGSGDKVSKHGA